MNFISNFFGTFKRFFDTLYEDLSFREQHCLELGANLMASFIELCFVIGFTIKGNWFMIIFSSFFFIIYLADSYRDMKYLEKDRDEEEEI